MADDTGGDRMGRLGPEHVGVVRAVARWMLPAGRTYTDDEVEMAAGVLLPAITAGHTRLRLTIPSGSASGAGTAGGAVLEVLEGNKLVVTIPWDELEIDDRPLRPPHDLLRQFGR